MTGRRAVVLLSGGMDSTTTAAIALHEGYVVHALSVRYGQRHAIELEAAAHVARALGVAEHRVVELDLRALGGSALTAAIDVPKDRPTHDIGEGIPVTYVPARNTILLALALGYAETVGAFDLFIGANALDYSGYPDCRPAFLDAFAALANLATRVGVEGHGRFHVHAPLLHLSKREIILRGRELGVDFALTRTCYDPAPDGTACARCDACQLRLKGFADAGLRDPVAYAR